MSEDWHNYQNFADWYDENYYAVGNEIMSVDKDILVHGNKLYSADTCLIVPQTVNSFFARVRSQNKDNGLPLGVKSRNGGKKYEAKLIWFGQYIYIGNYETPEEAFEAYKIEKEKRIKMLADMYKDYIPQKVYDALYNYKVYIDD